MPRCADDYQTARSGFAPTKRWAKRHLVDLAQARSRSGRRATRRRSEPDHARLALRPERDSPLGGRRGGAYPLAPPRCLYPSSAADHLGDLPARRGRPFPCQGEWLSSSGEGLDHFCVVGRIIQRGQPDSRIFQRDRSLCASSSQRVRSPAGQQA